MPVVHGAAGLISTGSGRNALSARRPWRARHCDRTGRARSIRSPQPPADRVFRIRYPDATTMIKRRARLRSRTPRKVRMSKLQGHRRAVDDPPAPPRRSVGAGPGGPGTPPSTSDRSPARPPPPAVGRTCHHGGSPDGPLGRRPPRPARRSGAGRPCWPILEGAMSCGYVVGRADDLLIYGLRLTAGTLLDRRC